MHHGPLYSHVSVIGATYIDRPGVDGSYCLKEPRSLTPPALRPFTPLRLGVDDVDSYEQLQTFVRTVALGSPVRTLSGYYGTQRTFTPCPGPNLFPTPHHHPIIFPAGDALHRACSQVLPCGSEPPGEQDGASAQARVGLLTQVGAND